MMKLLLALTAVSLAHAEPKKGDNCPMVMCMMFCQNGFLLGSDGCPICACNMQVKATPAPIPTNLGRGKCPKGCTSWYDGCNTCSCQNGRVGGCTRMACVMQNPPTCKAWAKPEPEPEMATPAPVIKRCPLLGCNPMLTVGVDKDKDGCIDTCVPLQPTTPTPVARCPRLLGCNPMVTKGVDTDGDGCVDICQPLGTPAPTIPCPLLGCNPMLTMGVDTDKDGCIDVCRPLKPATPSPVMCPLLGCNPMLTVAVDTDKDGCVDVCQPLPPAVFTDYNNYKTFMQGASQQDCKDHGGKYKVKRGKGTCKIAKEKKGVKCKGVADANCKMFSGCKSKKGKCRGKHKW